MKMNKLENIKLSFIIPVYNVEKYLCECIDSIVNQIKSECEIILINDGSTDSSGKICDEYDKKYSFVKTFHKENTGVADSRNFGLKHAVGKYVAFVDSDDFIAEQAINKIIDWINEYSADLCFLNAVKWYSNSKEEKVDTLFDRDKIFNKESEEVLYYLATMEKYPGSCWGKLFRREFLLEYNILFPSKRKHGEDLTFVRKVLLNANSFDYLPLIFYKYRQGRKESVTHSINVTSFLELSKFVIESLEECDSFKGKSIKKYESFMSFVGYEYGIMLYHYSRLSNDDKKKYYSILKDNSWVMKHGKTRKIKIIYFLIKVLGIRFIAYILNIYMSFRL